VEEDRLLDRRNERVADAAQHRVVRPDGKPVAPARLQCPDVLEQRVLLGGVGGTPDAVHHVLHGHDRVRWRVATVRVDQPRGVEHLLRVMGVQRRDDLRDRGEVPVDEFAQPPVVVGRSRHEQLEARRAEGVLAVDEQ
jgi:hypothetical protein